MIATYKKLEKGKPLESAGRKAAGLIPSGYGSRAARRTLCPFEVLWRIGIITNTCQRKEVPQGVAINPRNYPYFLVTTALDEWNCHEGDSQMKTKIAMITFVFALIAFTGISQAMDDVTYTPQTKFWMEKFQGGGPGAVGNVLMAVGKGFIFQHAMLDTLSRNDDGSYTTTYILGELTLNPSGPWGKKIKGKKKFRTLKASDITATNNSLSGADGHLKFTLKFGGKFDNADFCYDATATYEGYPQFKLDDEGKPVFQRGFGPDDFQAVIVFKDCPALP
jgi:hypothetical protein